MKVEIKVGERHVRADIFNTQTGEKILSCLPVKAEVNTWGDEIYFQIPVDEELDETARELVELGDLGYWPSGNAFCIFYGRTPISREGEIRPASAVNIIGKIIGDPLVFKGVKDGDEVFVRELEES